MQNKITPFQNPEVFLASFLKFMTPAVLFAAFGFILLCFILASMIFTYHWTNYDFKKGRIKRVQAVYFAVSGALLGTMLIALVYYTL